jgi:radical SAM superfamily enzyme YgiQ (UPF0313 family)
VEHVTSETLVEHESSRAVADRMPLGVLTVAAVCEKENYGCVVVDLNQAFLDRTQYGYRNIDFVSFAVDYLQSFEFDLLGLGTMCSSYPATLRIAAAIKSGRPSTTIVLGGPQASAVDLKTISKFSAIDIVVRGEADQSFPELLYALDKCENLAGVAGITFRNCGSAVRTPVAPLPFDLDAIPLPAFHLLPNVSSLRMLPVELGRGCPFSCTFCSTNDFFRRKFRLKSPSAVINQMKALNERYGTASFVLVHDMFTVDRKRVVEFCDAMIESRLGFEWSCSARTDCVDDDLLTLMATAGCRGLFFGIETGSARIQKVIEKDLPLSHAFSVIAAANDRGIETTVSTIIGFPEEELADIDATLNFVMDSTRFDHVEPQIGILAPLAGTPIYVRHQADLTFDPILADFSYSAWYEDLDQFEMIKSDPEIFSNFFAIPTCISRKYLFELKLFFHAAFHQLRWLLLAAHQEFGGIIRVFEAWLEQRSAPPDVVRYYISQAFKKDLVSFLSQIVTQAPDKYIAMQVLVSAQKILMKNDEDSATRRPSRRETASSNPSLCDGIEIVELQGNIEEVISALKDRRSLAADAVQPTAHLVRRSRQESELLPVRDCVARILSICDGSRSARQVMIQATGIALSDRGTLQFFTQLAREKILMFEATALS